MGVVATTVSAMDTLPEDMVYWPTGAATLLDVAWHPNGNIAVGVGYNGEIWHFDANAAPGTQWTQVDSGTNQYKCIDYSPQYDYFFLAGECGSAGTNQGYLWYLSPPYTNDLTDLHNWQGVNIENFVYYDMVIIEDNPVDYVLLAGKNDTGYGVISWSQAYNSNWAHAYPSAGAFVGQYYGIDEDTTGWAMAVGYGGGLARAEVWPIGNPTSASFISGGPSTAKLMDIAFNPATSDSLIVGEYSAWTYNAGPGWTQLTGFNSSADKFYGCAWNTNTKPTGAAYEEALLVGQNVVSLYAIVYKYHSGESNVVKTNLDASFESHSYWGVECRPVGSPLGLCVGASAGGFGFVNDASTDLIVDAFWPTVAQADFRQVAVNRENQQVEVNLQYNFYIRAYYDSLTGGESAWDQAIVDIYAWHDGGATGAGSNYTDTEPATTENLQFHLRYTGGSAYGVGGTWAMIFPTSAGDGDVETMLGPSGATESFANVGGQDWHTMTVYFTFNEQVRNASGGAGMIAAADETTKAGGLNDDYTWDFEVRVSDANNWTTADSMYNEWGVNKYVTLTASNSPSGNAPPNGLEVLLTDASDRSELRYSANCAHNVTVEIDDLTGPGTLLASKIAVNNFDTGVQANSECANTEYFDSGSDVIQVWGNGTYMSPSYRGRRTRGTMWGSTTMNHFTSLDWYAKVPVGTAEGSYTTPITFTIGQEP